MWAGEALPPPQRVCCRIEWESVDTVCLPYILGSRATHAKSISTNQLREATDRDIGHSFIANVVLNATSTYVCQQY
jgi:hypothetical protein